MTAYYKSLSNASKQVATDFFMEEFGSSKDNLIIDLQNLQDNLEKREAEQEKRKLR